MMFRSYSNTSEYFLRDYVAKAMVIMLSSRVKIEHLLACLNKMHDFDSERNSIIIGLFTS